MTVCHEFWSGYCWLIYAHFGEPMKPLWVMAGSHCHSWWKWLSDTWLHSQVSDTHSCHVCFAFFWNWCSTFLVTWLAFVEFLFGITLISLCPRGPVIDIIIIGWMLSSPYLTATTHFFVLWTLINWNKKQNTYQWLFALCFSGIYLSKM